MNACFHRFRVVGGEARSEDRSMDSGIGSGSGSVEAVVDMSITT